MSTTGVPEFKSRNGVTVPRWGAVILALFVWLVAIPLAHGALPWALSRLMRRYGWERGVPGFWNWLGMIPVGAAAALLIWILITGLAQTPERVRLSLTPPFLNVRGPYRWTRNPMYLAELGLSLGWTLFFGSLGVLLGGVVLLAVVTFVILPREERGLERAFGEIYLQYKQRVPRWFGKVPPA
jgi:protein-S-isoprenylcysteine O-methyltransferase Ste14